MDFVVSPQAYFRGASQIPGAEFNQSDQMNFKEVNKPILFLATLFTPMFGGLYDMPDGTTRELYYNGPVPCKYNKDKKCDSCGKCLQETWEK